MYKKDDQILIVTNRVGYMPQLRMCGPILQPIKVPVSVCQGMVAAGIPLYQVDPTKKVNMKLTITNIMDDKKFDVEETTVVEETVAPVVQKEIPVVSVVPSIDPEALKQNAVNVETDNSANTVEPEAAADAKPEETPVVEEAETDSEEATDETATPAATPNVQHHSSKKNKNKYQTNSAPATNK